MMLKTNKNINTSYAAKKVWHWNKLATHNKPEMETRAVSVDLFTEPYENGLFDIKPI